MFSQATLLLALAASATAHMTILNPVPFGKATLNSSPLAPGDFPCKQRAGVYDITEMNQWDAGTTQVVSFQGSAVHGGGSCQFSLTTDAEPTEKSQWKVIQSVIGGCPSNVSANLPEAPSGTGAATFPVKMPEDMPDGRYTFAWTWLNKVGNREFYMNCAPVQVGSGSSKASTKSVSAALSSLPDMFVANLPDTSCSTAENEDFEYPNPGKNVVTGFQATPGSKISGVGCSTMTKMGAGSGQLGSPQAPASKPTPSSAPGYGAPVASSAPAPAASSPPAYAAPPASSPPAYAAPPANSPPTYGGAPPASSGPTYGAPPVGGVFAPGAAPAPAAPATPSTPAAAPDAPASKPSNCTPCQTEGAVVCMGGNMFGLCNHGCAVPQALANGMSCSGGVVVASTKRSLKFPRGHLHRRHGASHLI
ncbi:lytic polysaccharide monooxygenase [Pyrenophora tritici-repentis]|uniref:FAP multi-domain protein n=1 Tax=Pyrenophora tritici-repentis TaxID=45151 RepID=A0A2W1G175_9PLEO|nr:hypothetical protein PtrV1_09719 [Pyrenophora tritici-repentis]KAF7442826.1 hypothetical protein A1F99_123330 [Pyrenophora tritici-repentis]KAF7568718.1 FAP multi-domain protein [Pyrenophora tritici-repentis]KAI0574567.1 hypothetical protein Alg130_09629 [Pyrenophora tritici-repentis]KAI0578589.1 hypothetical protein Alg215_06279 [Pyrenophora tritici-repentis]